MRYQATNGMRFEYSYRGEPNSAFFAYDSSSIVYTMPLEEWNRLSKDGHHKWRQEKYAQALQFFKLTHRRTP